MKLPHLHIKRTLLFIFIFLIVYTPIIFLSFLIYKSNKSISSLKMSQEEVKVSQENFKLNLSEELFNEHLALQEKQNLEDQLSLVETELDKVKNTPEGATYSNVNKIYEMYDDFAGK